MKKRDGDAYFGEILADTSIDYIILETGYLKLSVCLTSGFGLDTKKDRLYLSACFYFFIYIKLISSINPRFP